MSIIQTDEYIIGGAGRLDCVIMFMDWLMGNAEKPQTLLDDSLNGMLIEINSKRIFEFENLLTPVEMSFPYAIGSGASFAIAAMMAGANASDAVKIASDLDPFTGIGIDVISLEKEEI